MDHQQHSSGINWNLVYNQKCKSFEYLIGNSTVILSDQLPKQIDVLRFYFGQHSSVTDKKKISKVVEQIEKKYSDGGLKVRNIELIRVKVKRLVKSCKDLVAKRKLCQKSIAEKRRQEDFQEKIQNLFQVTHTIQKIPQGGMF